MHTDQDPKDTTEVYYKQAQNRVELGEIARAVRAAAMTRG
jgi:hypothetical protein